MECCIADGKERNMAMSKGVGHPVETLGRARAELARVVAMVDRLYDSSHLTLELLEAKRAVHSALMALAALDVSLGGTPSSGVGAREAGGVTREMSEGRGRTVAERLSIADPGFDSILYDDLLVPKSGDRIPETSAVGHTPTPL
jgi:hypothetical protein